MNEFSTAPQIVETFPRSNAQDVPLNTTEFTATFNVDLDRSQIANYVWLESGAGIRQPVRVAYDKKVITATLDDGVALKPDATYKLVFRGDSDLSDGFTEGLRSIFGKPMESSYAIAFTTVAVPAPVAPNGIRPIHLSATKQRPVFEWDDTAAAHYEVEVAKDNVFDTIHWGNQSATSPATPAEGINFPDGTYYWRVRGIDADGQKGEWGRTNIFVIDSLELGPISPEDTLPPEVEYTPLEIQEQIEFLDSFPKEGSSNIKTTLKTVSFRVLGEVAAEDVEFELYGESIFGEEEDHGELVGEITTVPGPGFTTVYITLPI